MDRAKAVHNDESLEAAFEQAKEILEPVVFPIKAYADDRGWSFMNQMQGVLGPEGQINYSVMYPNVVKAWHRHRLQTDFWLVLHGHLKVGVYCEDTDRAWNMIVGDKNPGVVVIPPPLWHGAATVSAENAGLLYYVTHSYNPVEPDEERRACDYFEGFDWGIQHR